MHSTILCARTFLGALCRRSPTINSVSGIGGSQWAIRSIFSNERSFHSACSVGPCQFSVSGHQTFPSKNDPSVRLSGSMIATAECLSVGTEYEEKVTVLQVTIKWRSSNSGMSRIRKSIFQSGTTISPGERGHRESTHPREIFMVLQLVLYCAQKGLFSDASDIGSCKAKCQAMMQRLVPLSGNPVTYVTSDNLMK